MIHPNHQAQLEAMAAEAAAETDPILYKHWQRIIENGGRDSAGDLVVIPAWPRTRFDPPGYEVDRLRWQGELPSEDGAPGTPGDFHEPPKFGWSWRGDAGYPPGENITIGVRGTEGLFEDYIADDEATARAAAWAHYDKVMEPVHRRRLYPGG